MKKSDNAFVIIKYNKDLYHVRFFLFFLLNTYLHTAMAQAPYTIEQLGPDPVLATFLLSLSTAFFVLISLVNYDATNFWLKASSDEKTKGQLFNIAWESGSGWSLIYAFACHAFFVVLIAMFWGNGTIYALAPIKISIIFAQMIPMFFMNVIEYGFKNFIVSWQFTGEHEARVLDMDQDSVKVTAATASGRLYRALQRTKPGEEAYCSLKTLKTVMYCFSHLTLWTVLLIPLVYAYTGDYLIATNSDTRTYYLAATCALLVAILFSETTKYSDARYHIRKARKILGLKTNGVSDSESVTKSAVTFHLGKYKFTPSHAPGVKSLKIAPTAACDPNHPLYAILATAENAADSQEVQAKLPGISATNMAVRQIGDKNDEFHLMLPATAEVTDSMYRAFGTRLGNPHMGWLVAPTHFVELQNGKPAISTTKDSNIASPWPRNPMMVDNADFALQRTPLISRLPNSVEGCSSGWDFFTHGVMGFGVGYGTAFNLSEAMVIGVVCNMFVGYQFTLHNNASALIAWWVTVFTPFVFASMGRPVQFYELFRYFFVFGWVIMFGTRWILPAEQRYPTTSYSLNNTAVVQENATLTSFDQSFTNQSISILNLAVASLLCFTAFVDLCRLGCRPKESKFISNTGDDKGLIGGESEADSVGTNSSMRSRRGLVR